MITDQAPAKLRFVRCPKCRSVLQELPNVTMYQCGGCGTVLQAKKRKVTTEGPIPNQTEIQVCDEEHPMDDDSSPEISENHLHSGNRESTVDLEDGNIESTPKTDIEESKDSVWNQDIGIDECVLGATLKRDDCLPKQIDRVDENKSENSNEKLHLRVRFSDEEDEKEIFMELVNEANRQKSRAVVEANTKPDEDSDVTSFEPHNPKSVLIHGRASSSGDLAYLTKFNHLEFSQRRSDEDLRSRNIYGSSPENEFFEERILNDDSVSSHSRLSFYNHEHISSVDTFDNIVALKDMPESPITRSYYGFLGSDSSSDGNDNQTPDRRFHLSKRTSKKEFLNKSRFNQEIQGENGYFTSSSLGKREPRLPFYQRDHELGYSDGNYSNDEMENFYLPNKREFLETEKMELLKKVRELENQLKRTNMSKNGSFSRLGDNQLHPDYDDYIHNREFGKYQDVRSGPLQSNYIDDPVLKVTALQSLEGSDACQINLSQIPFSSEAKTSSNRYIHKNNSNEIKVRAQRLYLGKKQTLPLTGGAPFVICYACSEVLQVPADFLLFQRRYHKLKCGNCSVILKFSLRNRTQIVYIDHISKVLDDPEPSFSKSFSTEEAPIEPQLDDMKKNYSEKKILNCKKGSKFTNLVKNLGYVRSSSKKSKAESSNSESEEVSASANLALHRLMGYHSATILLRADAGF